MIKYEDSTSKIYIIRNINPTVDFVFPVNKIDRENSEKIVSNMKLTKCIFRSCNV